jgi:hypothetical protein
MSPDQEDRRLPGRRAIAARKMASPPASAPIARSISHFDAPSRACPRAPVSIAAKDGVVIVEHRHDQRLRRRRHDLRCRAYPVQARHVEIHQHHIGLEEFPGFAGDRLLLCLASVACPKYAGRVCVGPSGRRYTLRYDCAKLAGNSAWIALSGRLAMPLPRRSHGSPHVLVRASSRCCLCLPERRRRAML